MEARNRTDRQTDIQRGAPRSRRQSETDPVNITREGILACGLVHRQNVIAKISADALLKAAHKRAIALWVVLREVDGLER